MQYFWLKLIHILSAALWLGVGFTATLNSYYFYGQEQTEVLKHFLQRTRYINRYFVGPALLFLLFSGTSMVFLAGYRMSATWLAWSLILLFMMGFFWHLGSYFQRKLLLCLNNGQKDYHSLLRRCLMTSAISLFLLMIIFALMVLKPS